MTEHDDTVEETVMLTRRGRRSRRSDAVDDVSAAVDVSADIDEHTVVVERNRPSDAVTATSDAAESAREAVDLVPQPDDDLDESTVMIGRRRRDGGPVDEPSAEEPAADDDVDDRTVAVVRRPKGDPSDSPDSDDDDSVDDRTVAVARRLKGKQSDSDDDAVDDRTVAVVRRPHGETPESDDAVDDRTIAVDRRRDREGASPEAEDHTVVVDRSIPSPSPSSPSSPRQRRSEVIAPPPSDGPEDLDVTVPAAPPRRVDAEPTPAIYKPRAAPRSPSRPPVVQGASAPTRVVDEQTASVGRHARRLSMLALAAVVGACVVSVGGLAALAAVVFG